MHNEPLRHDCPRTIRRIRRERGMTLAQTAQGAGTTAAQIMKLENGDRRLTLDWLERLSRALDCHVLDLIAPARSVPVAGFLTGAWAVQDAVHDPRQVTAADTTSVPVPRGCDPDAIIAVRRQTLDKADFFGGATFYFEAGDDSPVEAHDGRICLLTMPSGERHVRRVVIDPATRTVTYHAPVDAPLLAGQPVASAPCLAITGGPQAATILCGQRPLASNDIGRPLSGPQAHRLTAHRL